MLPTRDHPFMFPGHPPLPPFGADGDSPEPEPEAEDGDAGECEPNPWPLGLACRPLSNVFSLTNIRLQVDSQAPRPVYRAGLPAFSSERAASVLLGRMAYGRRHHAEMIQMKREEYWYINAHLITGGPPPPPPPAPAPAPAPAAPPQPSPGSAAPPNPASTPTATLPWLSGLPGFNPPSKPGAGAGPDGSMPPPPPRLPTARPPSARSWPRPAGVDEFSGEAMARRCVMEAARALSPACDWDAEDAAEAATLQRLGSHLEASGSGLAADLPARLAAGGGGGGSGVTEEELAALLAEAGLAPPPEPPAAAAAGPKGLFGALTGTIGRNLGLSLGGRRDGAAAAAAAGGGGGKAFRGEEVAGLERAAAIRLVESLAVRHAIARTFGLETDGDGCEEAGKDRWTCGLPARLARVAAARRAMAAAAAARRDGAAGSSSSRAASTATVGDGASASSSSPSASCTPGSVAGSAFGFASEFGSGFGFQGDGGGSPGDDATAIRILGPADAAVLMKERAWLGILDPSIAAANTSESQAAAFANAIGAGPGAGPGPSSGPGGPTPLTCLDARIGIRLAEKAVSAAVATARYLNRGKAIASQQDAAATFATTCVEYGASVLMPWRQDLGPGGPAAGPEPGQGSEALHAANVLLRYGELVLVVQAIQDHKSLFPVLLEDSLRHATLCFVQWAQRRGPRAGGAEAEGEWLRDQGRMAAMVWSQRAEGVGKAVDREEQKRYRDDASRLVELRIKAFAAGCDAEVAMRLPDPGAAAAAAAASGAASSAAVSSGGAVSSGTVTAAAAVEAGQEGQGGHGEEGWLGPYLAVARQRRLTENLEPNTRVLRTPPLALACRPPAATAAALHLAAWRTHVDCGSRFLDHVKLIKVEAAKTGYFYSRSAPAVPPHLVAVLRERVAFPTGKTALHLPHAPGASVEAMTSKVVDELSAKKAQKGAPLGLVVEATGAAALQAALAGIETAVDQLSSTVTARGGTDLRLFICLPDKSVKAATATSKHPATKQLIAVLRDVGKIRTHDSTAPLRPGGALRRDLAAAITAWAAAAEWEQLPLLLVASADPMPGSSTVRVQRQRVRA
ncbi:hypothetical protein HYH03_001623 [Edaphochlamys debaryana]|uniref:Uncharacterized protein n=1 Tax=Edaphochlamys debaryana TaxID=47281 RepID=A0A836C6M2_9CHLO|nr:hypothetical protein HYH03_001623 [Edaphochlamys debaryana]|eukprot:KAG2500862.1 hypothetical protein HYH03_001623 [Edaphochlamys debaryana]